MQDSVVIVTGGASGIGRGICKVMAERGADVAVADINLEGARKVEAELAEYGHKAKAYQVDVTKSAELEEMVKDVIAHFGRVDVLVNSAGVWAAPGYKDTTTSREEDWDLTFDVNVKGTVLASEAVATHMKERRAGRIINIASQGGRTGRSGGGAYGASKAAVIHLTQSTALDLAPYDITVNAICPGLLWTPMWEGIADRTRRNDPSLRDLTLRQVFEKSVKDRCPLQREQTPEDMGKAAAFLASDDARNITGQSLNVNGGIRMD